MLAPVGLDHLEEARRQPEKVRDRLVLADLHQLLPSILRRIVVRDARRRLDHLGQWPVSHTLAVRQAAADEHRRALEVGDEVAHQATLAHAGLTVDRHQMRAAITHGSLERVPQQRELRVASHEGRREGPERAAVPLGREQRAPDRDVLELEDAAHAGQLELDGLCREALGPCSDKDLVRLRDLLEPGRHVDDPPGRKRRVRVLRHDLARLDADSALDSQLGDLVPDLERRPQRSLCVVFVHSRDAEHRLQTVTGELLDSAAVGRDRAGHELEEPRHQAPGNLRIRRSD